jgi:hypothetical protein
MNRAVANNPVGTAPGTLDALRDDLAYYGKKFTKTNSPRIS